MHSFANTGVCPCIEFLMITQACDRTPALLGCSSLQSYQGQGKLWQVVVTIFFPASPFSPRRNVIAGVHSSLSSSPSHSSPRQLARRFFMGGGMASNFLLFASATCSFPGAVVEAFAESPQSPCRLIQEKDSCAAGNHRWSWTISRFGSDFGTAFSEQPV